MQSMKAVLLVLLWLAAMPAGALANAPTELGVGDYLREATLSSFSGNTKKFSDYRGKPLMINFWASWCSPCRDEMGSLERLSRRYGGKQFNVIGISIDDDGKAAAEFVKKSKLTFENYLDSNVFLENMLGAHTIPMTILVDANGRVVGKVRGLQEWDRPQLLELIGKTFNLKL